MSSRLGNYVTVALRGLARHRAYTAISILGLALGLAACLLILLYIRYETTYDTWLPVHERIYQLQATWHERGQPVTQNQTSPLAAHQALARLPEVEAFTIAAPGRVNIARGGEHFYADVLSVDPAFFDIFKLPFRQGSAATALPNVTSAVLTESEALKQFGTADALGRTLTAGSGDNKVDLKVTGIIRDLPKNTHLKLGTILRFDPADYAASPGMLSSWGAMGQYHYVRLRPGASADAVNAAFPAWERRMIPPQRVGGRLGSQAEVMDLKLVKVADVHLGAAQLNPMTPGNDSRTVATFGIVAGLILLMACINFINLSTARAGQRAREVALRKVLGASRRQLVVQFLGESLLLSGVAMLIALAATELTAPWLGRFLGIDLSVRYLGTGGFLFPVLALIAIVGLVGGLYPAFFLSRFEPAQVLRANKSAAEPQGSGRLRNLLVVAQFAISTGLIVCTWVVWSQTRYVETFDPGYERDGLVQVEGAWRFGSGGNYEAFRKQLLAQPGIAGVARTNIGVVALNKSIQTVELPGDPNPLDVGVYKTDPDFFPTMGSRLLAGRLFGDAHAEDKVVRSADPGTPIDPALKTRGLNVVVNRRAAAQFGYRDPAQAVGKQVKIGLEGEDGYPSTVIGVVEDTRIRTARDAIEPLVYTYDPPRTSELIVRYRASPRAAMAAIGQVWRNFFADVPFDAAFAEDLVANLYERERARTTIFAAFSGLAVIISCLGLFGLAAFQTERRTKEIGIRKVLGATVHDIVRLLAWQFSKPVILANLVAWPVAWWAMRDWLNTYDARIPLGPGPFLLAALLAFAIAIGTVAGHAIRVARLNPIHALRYE